VVFKNLALPLRKMTSDSGMELGMHVPTPIFNKRRVLVCLSLGLGLAGVYAVLMGVPFGAGVQESTTDLSGALRGSSMFPVPALSASPRTMSQQQISLGGMSVQAMQDTLKTYGVPSSPLQKFALTQFAATRDPSMRAQVREEFSSLSPAIKAEVRKMSREVTVRAEAVASDLAKGESDLKLENMAGITAPLGLWDPLELGVDIPAGRLYFYREAELKNGRVAMLAFLGILLTDKLGVHPWFGDGSYVSAILSHTSVDPAVAEKFWPALGIVCGAAELFSYPDRSKAPGDLGFDPLGMKPKKESEFLELQNKELNNGRLAMMAVAGIYGAELMAGVRWR